MVQSGNGTRLSVKALPVFAGCRKLLFQDFDRHFATDFWIMSEVDAAHGPATQAATNLVAVNGRMGGHRGQRLALAAKGLNDFGQGLGAQVGVCRLAMGTAADAHGPMGAQIEAASGDDVKGRRVGVETLLT